MTTPTGDPSATAESRSLRDRYRLFIARYEVAWELVFGILAILFVAIGFIEDGLPEPQREALLWAEVGLTVVFLVEYGSRLWAAQDRVAHALEHWPDLIALVPAIRGARILRVLRLLRLIRVFSGAYRAMDRVPGLARHADFARLFLSWVALGVICSISVLAAEGDDPLATIRSAETALWWGVGALTTVGTDVQPRTFEGRIAGMFAMLLGVFLFSGVTATITSYLVREKASPARDPAAQLVDLSRLADAGRLTQAEYEWRKRRSSRTRAVQSHSERVHWATTPATRRSAQRSSELASDDIKSPRSLLCRR